MYCILLSNNDLRNNKFYNKNLVANKISLLRLSNACLIVGEN